MHKVSESSQQITVNPVHPSPLSSSYSYFYHSSAQCADASGTILYDNTPRGPSFFIVGACYEAGELRSQKPL
jgi:hypothetical protein